MSAFLSRPLGPGSSWTPGSGSWPGTTGRTPPPDELLAAAVGDVAWMELSLEKAGSPLRQDQHGLTAVHVAALHCRLGCLRRLLERHGVEPELASSTGWRPLHLACNARRGARPALLCVRYLLARGARANVSNEDSVTPLHVASSEGLLGCVRALLEAGADPSLRDLRRHRPLDLARLWGHRKCARLLAGVIWMDEKHEAAAEDAELLRLGRRVLAEEQRHFGECEDERQFVNAMSFLGWLEDKQLPAPPAARLAPPVADSRRGRLGGRAGASRARRAAGQPGGAPNPGTAQPAPGLAPGRAAGTRLEPGTNLVRASITTGRGVTALPVLTPREPWNVSTNPSSAPQTDIARPPGGAPGTWPDDGVDDDAAVTSAAGGKRSPGSRRRFRAFVLSKVTEQEAGEAERDDDDDHDGDDDCDGGRGADDGPGGDGGGRRAEAVRRALRGRGGKVPGCRLSGPRDFSARDSVAELPRKRCPRDASRLRGEVAMHLCETAESALFRGAWSER